MEEDMSPPTKMELIERHARELAELLDDYGDTALAPRIGPSWVGRLQSQLKHLAAEARCE